jgi:hypothetical protein
VLLGIILLWWTELVKNRQAIMGKRKISFYQTLDRWMIPTREQINIIIAKKEKEKNTIVSEREPSLPVC